MSASLPTTIRGADCCAPPCSDSTSSQVVGPKGDPGSPGTNGIDGKNSFTSLTANFTMPASLASASATVVDSTWATVGQIVYVQNAGWLQVTAKTDSTHLTLKNLETATAYTDNVAPATVVPNGSTISPGGLQGPQGSASSATLNSVSPTTTKGDLIVDNGANNPAANDVRLAAGTNGQILASDSTAGTGLAWKSVVPNAATDNAVARFDGASGTPVPIQNSKLIITDNGAVQASGSGGNARGADAVDLQVTRAAADQVASGVNAVIAGGENNKASGTHSAVLGGTGNVATSGNASVVGGSSNSATGSSSFVGGGSNVSASAGTSFAGGGTSNTAAATGSGIVAGNGNTTSGQNAFIGAGNANNASGIASFVGAGDSNTASGESSTVIGSNGLANKYAQFVLSSSAFSNNGDAQRTELVWAASTTDATANIEMFIDGSGLRATVPSNTSWGFDILMTVRRDTGTDAIFSAKGGIRNNGGVVTMTAAATVAVIADGSGGTYGVAGSFAVTADAANGSLKLAVTGVVGNNLRWVAHGRIVEVGS